MLDEQLDILARELGEVAERIERESALRIDAAVADLRRIGAEWELRLTTLERAVNDRLAAVKDGKDGRDGIDGKDGLPGADGKDGAPGERGADGKDGRDGIDGKDGLPGADGKDGVPGERGADGKDGRDGIDGKDGLPGADGKDGVPGERGADGVFPEARAWVDGVHYRGDVCSHAGSTYQALRDTAKMPPHDDWICLAAAGLNGRDGRSPKVRDTYSADVKDYAELDIVALGGAAFIARRDNPGACPGDGWQLIAMQGKRGNAGERGARGDRGAAGPAIERMLIDGEGMLTIVNADASTVQCDLYPLLTKVQQR